ncbi:hypothetical protein EXM22_10455 [Oceanispirochaeta crateris]|uniref:Uncharacterized protein n=1 Tax=Oceanispirochaeta crateris TaxID=2518645 RepID=A0A5C1QJS1_9SPIO|nr:hypothetical protein [Oceanispirochaeta crateris]QEN08383.1 hypothetical protein EXM22_10455 [Oceanispirochaeta crateris]
MNDSNSDLQTELKESLGIDGVAWSLGRLLSNPGSFDTPLWGLFVYDSKRQLHFIRFHQENWFSALVHSGTGSVRKDSGDILIHLCFSPEKTLSLMRVHKRGFFGFLTTPSPRFHLLQEGSEDRVIFELENPGKDLLELLEQISR